VSDLFSLDSIQFYLDLYLGYCLWGREVFGYNRHTYKIVKGGVLRHVHIGPFVIGFYRGRIVFGVEYRRKRRKG